MAKIILHLLIIFILGLAPVRVCGQEYREYAPAEMPNVQKSDRRQFISDPENLLSPGVRNQLNIRLDSLRRNTTAEMAVAIVPSLGDLTIEEYAEKLFTNWGVGKADKDNGVLLLISPGSRKARIQTGYGVEGILPDMVCDRIIRQSIIPAMRNDDLDAATTGAVNMISQVISDPEYAEELRSSQTGSREDAEREEELEAAFKGLFIGVMALSFIALLVLLIMQTRKLRHSSTYHKAKEWRSRLPLYGLLAVTSGLTGFPLFLIAWLSYRRNRNHSRKCANCGTKMHKLDEKTDNEYLDPSQDLEERLGSVDYDVWRCPSCGELEIYPFHESSSKFKKCPSCGTHAYHLAKTRILQPATTRQAGRGRKIYKCEYCGHEDHEDFVIPKKENDAALLGTAAALGAMSSGRGGGGGFGGGFGGGSTGGGGASGGW